MANIIKCKKSQVIKILEIKNNKCILNPKWWWMAKFKWQENTVKKELMLDNTKLKVCIWKNCFKYLSV